MRSSLIIISFFVAGLLLAYWGVLPEGLADGDLSMYALYLLMFLVGISIGSDMKALRALKDGRQCVGQPVFAGAHAVGLFGSRFRFRLLFSVLGIHYGVSRRGVGHGGTRGKYCPGNHHAAGGSFAGLLVWQACANLFGRGDDDGYDASRYQSLFRKGVCCGVYFSRFCGGFQCAFPCDFFLQVVMG